VKFNISVHFEKIAKNFSDGTEFFFSLSNADKIEEKTSISAALLRYICMGKAGEITSVKFLYREKIR